jgi:hypothetical protein
MGGSQSGADKPAHRVESKGEGTVDRRETCPCSVAHSLVSSLLAEDEPLIKQPTDQELYDIVARRRSLPLFLKELVAPDKQHLVRA